MSQRDGRPRRALRVLVPAAAAAALALTGLASLFTVDATEYGVVTRFGRIVRVVDEPGLGFKLPVDTVKRLDRRLLYLSTRPVECVSTDRKNLQVATLATWRIADPARFLATLGTRGTAERRLADAIVGQVGAVLGRHPFAALVAPELSESRFGAIVAEVRAGVRALVSSEYGIEVVDMGLRQLALPQQNRQSVFERMKAERGRIAMQLRAEGKSQSRRMIAEADRERTRILAEADEQARRLDGEGEAEAMRIFAGEFGADPAFFKLMRTLEAYERILDDKTTLFLPAESELLRLLQPHSAAGQHRNAPFKPDPRNGGTVGIDLENREPPRREKP